MRAGQRRAQRFVSALQGRCAGAEYRLDGNTRATGHRADNIGFQERRRAAICAAAAVGSTGF